jgi:hypothetical protein
MNISERRSNYYSSMPRFPESCLRRYTEKISPEKLKSVLKAVNFTYDRLSPTGCSKNILAVNSNLDKEIESIKLKISTNDLGIQIISSEMHPGYRSKSFLTPCSQSKLPPISSPTPNSHSKLPPISSRTPDSHSKLPYVSSLTPDSHSKLPDTNSLPKKFSSRDISESILNSAYPKNLSFISKQTSRIKKLEKIINQCQGIEDEINSDNHQQQVFIETNKDYCGEIFKAIESTDPHKKLIERCRDHGKVTDDDRELVKATKALKRNKKIWKLNHISFMKNVDRAVNSIPIKKLN